MGREIRRVPANWQHPKYTEDGARHSAQIGRYKPMFERSYKEALHEWFTENELWESGKHRYQIEHPEYLTEYPRYASYGGEPPNSDYYVPEWKPQEKTWYQVYETVSEGTPVSPPFETQQELVDYLVSNGDFWDQDRRKRGNSPMNYEPWTRQQAEAFVLGDGWCPSLVFTPEHGLQSGVEALVSLRKETAATDGGVNTATANQEL